MDLPSSCVCVTVYGDSRPSLPARQAELKHHSERTMKERADSSQRLAFFADQLVTAACHRDLKVLVACAKQIVDEGECMALLDKLARKIREARARFLMEARELLRQPDISSPPEIISEGRCFLRDGDPKRCGVCDAREVCSLSAVKEVTV